MTTPGYVHGGTDAREVARLEKQADFTASFTFSRLPAQPGERLLDLATGVGAMGSRLQHSFPATKVVGVDLSASQLSAARASHPDFPVLRGDATRLPFADGTFDRVHASWLLEHVPDPVAVLREVHRVLRPGGTCHFVEVNNASFSCAPAFDEVTHVMTSLNEAQVRAGGDPYVGQKLDAHFRAAGFTRFTISPAPLVGTQRDSAMLKAMVDEFAEIFDGLDESLGSTLGKSLTAAAAHLRSLRDRPNAELRYTAVIGMGVRT